MATAKELLVAAGVTDEVLTIDLDTRIITVPETIKNLGVESDDDVKRLYFSMPTQYGEFDLSEFMIRINYVNANGEGDCYPVTDVKLSEDGSSMTFSWLVGRFAFNGQGNVEFNVCLKKLDEDSVIIKEFNTTTAILPVLRGKETCEAIVQENPDVIEYILANLGGTGTVKSVNGNLPDLEGNVEDISDWNKTINRPFGDDVTAAFSVDDTESPEEVEFWDDAEAATTFCKLADMLTDIESLAGATVTYLDAGVKKQIVLDSVIWDSSNFINGSGPDISKAIYSWTAYINTFFGAGTIPDRILYRTAPVLGATVYIAMEDVTVSGLTLPAGIWYSTLLDNTRIDSIKYTGFKKIDLKYLPETSIGEYVCDTTALNFSNWNDGTFTETASGEIITHTVTFDTVGRPASIDGITIIWE